MLFLAEDTEYEARVRPYYALYAPWSGAGSRST